MHAVYTRSWGSSLPVDRRLSLPFPYYAPKGLAISSCPDITPHLTTIPRVSIYFTYERLLL